MIKIPQCYFCRRFHKGGGKKCDAYPGGIPREVYWNEVDHTKPYKGDRGLTFLDVIGEETSNRSAPFEGIQCAYDEDPRPIRAARAEGSEDLQSTAGHP